MKVISKRHEDQESGFALFVALFALMLLSAIGLAMVFSADTETSIDSNYRDQQTATYAALSGLQEARDRLISGSTVVLGGTTTTTVSGKLTWPTDLPGTAGNVIYIINPRPGDPIPIQPWNPSNKYYDWELCSSQETMPSGFCTSGAPPTTSTWYTVIDDSNTTAGASWHRTVPLNFKWVRINLKAHNMVTPVPVSSTSDTNMVCWSGSGQIDLPSGYNKDCSPTGALSGINVPTGATGYTSTPTVTIAAPPSGGTQAVAHAVLTNTLTGAVSGISLTSAGSGYTSAPTVTLVGGGGTGATAVATVVPANSHPVSSITLNNAGSPTGCFASATPPVVNIVPTNGGSGAHADAVMSTTPNCIKSWTVGGSCSSFGGMSKTVTTGNGGGSGFSGTIWFKNNGNIDNNPAPSITNPGTGYTSVPTGSATTIVGGCATITYSLGYQMTGVTLTNGGSGYLAAPNVTLGTAPVTGGTPSLSATVSSGSPNAGQIASLTLQFGGSAYTSAPTVVFSGGGGTGATATTTLATSGQVTGFDFACTGCSYGSGYAAPPAVSITGGGVGSTVATTGILAGTTYYGQIVQVTSYAETPTLSARQGSRAMVQEELTTNLRYPFQFSIGGAITIPGPNPNFGTPNSNNFYVNGNDANSCGGVAVAKPSIDVYDPGNTSAIDDMIGQLARPDHYPGMQASPDVENGTYITGNPTPSALQQFVDTLQSYTPIAQQYLSTSPINPDPATFQTFALTTSTLNPTSNPPITFVQGNATIQGNQTGSGILVVTGNLVLGGNYSFNGLILVIGQGTVTYSGGGNGQVNGSLYTAKINNSSGAQLSTLGTPTMDYSGGGGNGVHYDHCYADNLLGNIPQTPPNANDKPLTVISQRSIYR